MISDLEKKIKFGVSFVYGLHNIGTRKVLWVELSNIVENIDMPWVAMGDFSTVFDVESM